MSILQFDGDGINVDNSQQGGSIRAAFTISDLTLCTNGNGDNTAIRFTGKPGPDLGKQLTCWNCQLRGTDYSGAWRVGIDLNYAAGSDIRGVYMLGQTDDVSRMSYGIRLNRISTDVKILGCYFYWLSTGVGIVGDMPEQVVRDQWNAGEGVVISFNHFVPVQIGVLSAESWGNYIVVDHNHMDAFIRGVQLGSGVPRGSGFSRVTNNLIFKNGSSSNEFVGIHVYGDQTTIIGNDVANRGIGGATNGIVLESPAQRCRIIGNNLKDQDTGIWVKAGANANLITNNTRISPSPDSGDLILNQGLENVCTDNLDLR